MVNCVVNAHAHAAQDTCKNDGQQKVDIKQCDGRGANAGQNTAIGKACYLGIEKVHGAAGNLRQQGYENYDDANATNPMVHGAPKKQALGQYLQVTDGGGAGGG